MNIEKGVFRDPNMVYLCARTGKKIKYPKEEE